MMRAAFLALIRPCRPLKKSIMALKLLALRAEIQDKVFVSFYRKPEGRGK